jgi:stage II sporulation protein D
MTGPNTRVTRAVRWLVPACFGSVVVSAAVMVACAPLTPIVPAAPSPAPSGGAPAPVVRGEQAGRLQHDRTAYVALDGRAVAAVVSATGEWRIDEQGGRVALVKGAGGEGWRIEQRGTLLRVAGDGGDATPWRAGPFVARPNVAGSYLRYGTRRYRGELWFTPTDSGILVVNHVSVEDYLRGVVPIELGTRQPTDRAALEAQAIAARSYSYIRVPADGAREPASGWHMLATVQNQLYTGMDVEHPVVNAAVDATSGLVLRYNGLLVDGPYYSSCGGRTAGPREAWRDAREEPYLQPVDDTDPSTGRPYCDISPRNHWVAEFDEAQLGDIVRRALETAGARDPRPAAVTELRVGERTPSGRAASLVLRTDRGDVRVAARDIRAVLRDARGAILSSTYFSVERESRARGHLSGVSLRGAGNGHGVGMCQWGAIGRARAGADARSILRHYYPGTVVGFAD